MTRLDKGFLSFVAALFLTASVAFGAGGCASLGLAQPQSFDQKLAEAYGVHTAVVQAATVAVKAGSITAGDGAQVADLANQSRQLLDAAKTAETLNDPSTAAGKLALAAGLLAQLQTYLNTHAGH